MSKDLKPCPFCGGVAKIALEFKRLGMMHVKEYFYVKCSKCDTRVADRTFWDSEEEAVSAWNKRVSEDA